MAKDNTKYTLQLEFSATAHKRLTEMEKKSGASCAELIRDALRVYEYLLNQGKQGFELVLVKDGKPVKAVRLIL